MREVILGNLTIAMHWLLRIFPIEWCSHVGYLMGRMIGPRHRKASEQLRKNIQKLRPDVGSEKAMDAFVKQSFGNLGRVMAEFSVLRRIWASDRTTIEGLMHLNAAKALERPIIFLFLHLGNWEIIGPKLYPLLNRRVIQIYQLIDNRYQLRIAENVRRPYAHGLITTGPSVGKKIYNKLRDGYHLNIAVDELVNGELNTPSFGRPQSLSGNLSLAVRFAKLTNAILCPVYATRTKGARFVVHIVSPVVLDFTQWDKAKLTSSISALDALMGSIIRKHLDQWYYNTALIEDIDMPSTEVVL